MKTHSAILTRHPAVSFPAPLAPSPALSSARPKSRPALQAGLTSALVVWQETGDLAALDLALRLHRALHAAADPAALPAFPTITRCAWCPPEKTEPLTSFAARHALMLSDGCCEACAGRLREDMQRVLADISRGGKAGAA